MLVLATLVHGAALAHKPSDSYLSLRASPNSEDVRVRWDIALRDLDYVLELDRDGNGELTWGEVRTRADDITRYATRHLALTSDDKACQWQPPEPMQLDKHSDGTYAVLTMNARCDSDKLRELKLRYSLLFDVDPSHRGLVKWQPTAGDSSQALVFSSTSAEQVLGFQPQGPWSTLRQYLQDGVWHIWIGFDHILFLLALLLPAVLVRREGQIEAAPRFGGALIEVVKVVTAFTVAHSITLTLAALEVISLPSRVVESAIALSVIVAALNNLRGGVDSRRWIMAFAFGLLHGFGFASVLADLGLPQDALLLALIGFNVGVEIGQLAIVAVFLPLAFALRKTAFYRIGVLKVGSILVALMALWWFIQRAFDIQGGPF
ncbi:MAG: HupE/UreJ family protein [Ramlibacter sp.]|nr:HupE/UreJ family protein [Ramlibacter sp.]